MIIPITIKVPSYKAYTLDAQIDIGAMSSCCKYKAIPSYHWKPTTVHFKEANKQLMNISHVAPEFPIGLASQEVYVTLYNLTRDQTCCLVKIL